MQKSYNLHINIPLLPLEICLLAPDVLEVMRVDTRLGQDSNVSTLEVVQNCVAEV